VNDPKKWLILSECAWLAGLGLVFGLPWTVVIWPLALYVALGYRRWSPAVLILFLAGGLAGPIIFSHLPLVAVTAVALWRGLSLSRNDFLDMRFPFVWGILGSIAEFIVKPAWGWIPLLLVASFSLIAMVPYGKRPLLERWSFALQLLAIGVISGLAASALIWLTPWGSILRSAFYLIATPITWLLSLIPFAKLKAKPNKAKGIVGKISAPKIPHPAKYTGPNHWIAPVLISLAIVLALALLYLLWRYLNRQNRPPAAVKDDRAIIHEHIERPANWFRNPFSPLPPVRTQVRHILQEARKHGHSRAETETFREWAKLAHQEKTPEAGLLLYDEVRYGDRPDTREAAESLRHTWPEWPKEERPNLGARILGRSGQSSKQANPR